MDTQVTTVADQGNSIEMFISKGLEKGVDIQTMERLFAMRNEFIAQKAKSEFDIAMSNFQGDCPTIEKTKSVHTNSGKKAYSYAPIESIVKQVQPLLKRERLSFSFKVEILEQGVKAICIVKHISGHNESSEMQVPLGSKTDIMSNSQVTAAASTFAKRYAFCNAFGIMTGDEDVDGKDLNAPKGEKEANKAINPKAKIMFLLKELGIKAGKGKEDVQKQIKQLTGIQPDETQESLEDIVCRLEILVNEKKENADTKVRG